MALATPEVFGELLTNIIAAIIILLIGFVIGKILGSVLHKFFSTVFTGKKIKGKNKNKSSFALGLSSIISIFIYIAAVILALERLGITFFVLKIILAIISIIVLGALLFLFIDFVANFYFGVNLMLTKKIEKGDFVKIKKVEGTVNKITLIHTKIITKEGEVFIIPNEIFFRNKFSREKKDSEIRITQK